MLHEASRKVEQVAGLETADAMRFAGLRRKDWENAIKRRLYTEQPKTTTTQARVFEMDDLVAAYVLGQLYEREVLPKFACQIAVDVRRALRKSDAIKTLSAWKVVRGDQPRVVVSEAKPVPDAIELFRFEVAAIRRRARLGIEAKRMEELRPSGRKQ
jgi:hypothetical protein